MYIEKYIFILFSLIHDKFILNMNIMAIRFVCNNIKYILIFKNIYIHFFNIILIFKLYCWNKINAIKK